MNIILETVYKGILIEVDFFVCVLCFFDAHYKIRTSIC